MQKVRQILHNRVCYFKHTDRITSVYYYVLFSAFKYKSWKLETFIYIKNW